MFCNICKKEFLTYISLSKHLRTHNINSKDYYVKYLNNNNLGLCLTCNKETKFLSLEKGFASFCCSSCVSKNEDIKQRKKITLLKNYGVESPLQNDDLKNKYKQTMISKYGEKSVLESSILKEKIKNTLSEKYNLEHPSQIEFVKIKKKNKYLEKYGVDHISKCNKIKKQKKLKSLEKYGTEHIFQSQYIKDKIRETNLNRYGFEYYSQSNIFKEKVKQKLRIKNFERLLNSDKFKEKIIPNFNIDEYQGIGNNKDFQPKYEWICKNCNSVFLDRINNGHIPRCLKCYPIVLQNKSIYEDELFEYCKSVYSKKIIRSDREILENNLELDLFFPEDDFAIEFNGLYWHSERNGNKKWNYHLKKTLLCQRKKIQLIHIFEDEWIEKQDIVKSIIKSKLNLTKRIFARKCKIQEIDHELAFEFLNNNHLQGFINGKHFGLFFDNVLISCLTMGKSRFNKKFEWEILRFCNKNNHTIIGGLSKLFNYFQIQYKPNSVITYCDLRYGNGKAYENLNFKLIGHSRPSYFYLENNQRKNRLNFRKNTLPEKLSIYDPNLTEWENMQLNNYDRIWDCGNNVYIMEYK